MRRIRGFTFDLQRFAEDGGQGNSQPSGNAPAGGGQEPAGQGGEQGGQAPPDEKLTPEELRKELERARKEAARYRTERKALEEQVNKLRQDLAKALGLAQDAPPDQATKQIEQLRAQLRQERLRNAFYRLAAKEQVDPELTLAYLQAAGDLDGLDPDGDDFEKQLQASIREAVKAKPVLRAGAGEAAAGAGGGNPARGDQPTPVQAAARRVLQRYGVEPQGQQAPGAPQRPERRRAWTVIGGR